jgi:hypothetical protein
LRLKIKIKHKKVKFITEEVKTKLKKRKAGNKRTLGIVLFTVIAGLGLGVTVALATPYIPISNVYSNIRVCNGAVSQPAAYAGSFPTPTVNWSISSLSTGFPASSQNAFYVEVDNNNSFTSTEYSSGTVTSNLKLHQIPSGSLSFCDTYYWRVGVRDQHNSWTGWATGGPFTTNHKDVTPRYSYTCLTTAPPNCTFNDCGEQLFGTAACRVTDHGCEKDNLEPAGVCEANGVTCFQPMKTCAVCPGGYKEATP